MTSPEVSGHSLHQSITRSSARHVLNCRTASATWSKWNILININLMCLFCNIRFILDMLRKDHLRLRIHSPHSPLQWRHTCFRLTRTSSSNFVVCFIWSQGTHLKTNVTPRPKSGKSRHSKGYSGWVVVSNKSGMERSINLVERRQEMLCVHWNLWRQNVNKSMAPSFNWSFSEWQMFKGY